MQKWNVVIVVCLAVLLGSLGMGSDLRAETIELRYGLWAKEGEAQHLGALKFKEVLEAESDGKFSVTVYPGNQLGTPREMLAQLALGTTQICASGDPGIKEIEYLALPYLMKGIGNYTAVINSEIGEEWNKILVDKRKVRLLGFLPRSPRQISANTVINTMADLEGLKLRAPERDYYVKSIAALGAKPTPMAFKEVYTALQTGIVDGQENPIETIYAQKFYEVQDCVAMVDYIDKPAYVMIGESFWQERTPEERELIKKAQAASRTMVEEILPEQQEEFMQKMEEAGIVFTYPDKAEFIEATQPVRDELGTEVWGEETYKKIVEIGQQDL
ncbi:DctP family TRAP transporter solute-binding subunit [candidate division KSB3 bacterium]|uniref:DctP family TRAP transporter solute-binding subunit n=1 Tax=candidate division KSB3 bacterium TaxID=2044937 RepID=A0A9D5Q7Z4_9BACT|nr:DctP family TRAP transporter solute-binding subunit [candidate division KSB3 bacterium]MBD3326953.1 DctP family TRAP transporter solute-binding subunit [candidate division KSB3 bacterium]